VFSVQGSGFRVQVSGFDEGVTEALIERGVHERRGARVHACFRGLFKTGRQATLVNLVSSSRSRYVNHIFLT